MFVPLDRRGELGETITETDPTRLVRELHATAIAINQAKGRGDVAGVSAMLAHFRAVADAYRRTGDGDLTTFDRLILSTGRWVEQAAAAVPGAVAWLPGAVGKGLLMGLWPWALGAGLLFWFKGQAGRGRQTW